MKNSVLTAAVGPVVCASFLAALAPGQTAAVKVQVKRVVKVYIAAQPAYSISYDYDATGQPSVRINGLGAVPSQGSFSYISLDKQLEFRDATASRILTTIPLKETVVAASKPPQTEIPNDEEFPNSFRVYQWDSAAPLQLRANNVLNQYFRYRPHEEGHITYIATTYTPLTLPNAPRGVLGEAAILLSFPYDQSPAKYSFRVQLLAKEGRTHSDEYRQTSEPAVLSAAQALVERIVEEMRHGVPPKP